MDAGTDGAEGERRDWDRFSKDAVVSGLGGVLAATGIDIAVAALVPVPVELPAGTQRADLVFTSAGGRVVHIEIQQRPDPGMGLRMLEYGARIATSPRIPVRVRTLRQVVIQLSGPPMPERYDLSDVAGHFRLLHTPTTPVEVFLATPALAPFALTMEEPRRVGPVLDRIAAVNDPDLRASLATRALFLAPACALS
jgi:hypothetical protein